MSNPKESAPAAASPAKADSSAEQGPVIVLEEPVQLGSMKVTELRFPPSLRGRHLRRFSSGDGKLDGNVLLHIAADATGQPDRVMDELSGRDAARVMQTVTGFLALAGFIGTTSAAS